MKKAKKIILMLVSILFIGFFIHPEKIIYEPKIIGQVIDENGNPIENAIVARIEGKHWKNKEFGYYESEEYKSQTVKTDINGNFELAEKSRIDWIHNIPFVLPFCWCNTEFEVSKIGFETHKTEFGDFSEYNENLNACKGIIFTPKITLKKL